MKPFPIITLLPLAACQAAPAPKPAIGMPNPASAYCVEQGGRLEIRNSTSGDSGYCHLPDGRVVEEWAFSGRSPASEKLNRHASPFRENPELRKIMEY